MGYFGGCGGRFEVVMSKPTKKDRRMRLNVGCADLGGRYFVYGYQGFTDAGIADLAGYPPGVCYRQKLVDGEWVTVGIVKEEQK